MILCLHLCNGWFCYNDLFFVSVDDSLLDIWDLFHIKSHLIHHSSHFTITAAHHDDSSPLRLFKLSLTLMAIPLLKSEIISEDKTAFPTAITLSLYNIRVSD